MTKPTIHEYNVQTGESIEREMTDEEYAQWLEDGKKAEAEAAAWKAEETAKAEAKAAALAKLTALGLTEEEAKAIAG